MLECLSQAEWDRINDDYKTVEPDGQRFILRPAGNGSTVIVPVIVKKPDPNTRRSGTSALRNCNS